MPNFKKYKLFRFKGRQPRELIWKPNIFKLWYYYAKLSGNYPKEFGELANMSFRDWWFDPKYGFELFCEPYDGDAVKYASADSSQSSSTMLLEVDLTVQEEKLNYLFTRFLDRNLNHSLNKPLTWKTSKALFKPSIAPKNFKADKLKVMLKVYQLMQQGVTRAVIAERMKFVPDAAIKHRKKVFGLRRRNKLLTEQEAKHDELVGAQYEAAMRKVSRYRQNVEKIFKSIEKGTFP